MTFLFAIVLEEGSVTVVSLWSLKDSCLWLGKSSEGAGRGGGLRALFRTHNVSFKCVTVACRYCPISHRNESGVERYLSEISVPRLCF